MNVFAYACVAAVAVGDVVSAQLIATWSLGPMHLCPLEYWYAVKTSHHWEVNFKASNKITPELPTK